MLKKVQFFALVLLLGTQIVIGFIVIPLIFKYIHQLIEPLSIAKDIGMNHIVLMKSAKLADNIAGDIVGHLLDYISYISMLTILILLFINNIPQVKISSFYDVNSKKIKLRKYILILALFLIFIHQFFIIRVIKSLKLNKNNWLHNIIGGDFNMWHLISEYTFIIIVVVSLIYSFFWIKDNIIIHQV